MRADDIAQIMDIERESFPSMWPQTAYRRELTNKLAHYIVLTEQGEQADSHVVSPNGLWGTLRKIVGGDGARAEDERVIGFIGVWLMIGEAHVVTVAVRQEHRRRGIGERLLLACLDDAITANHEEATLEVRRSNDVAQRLYEKYGFHRVGVRARYYTDNQEDAVLMTATEIDSPGYARQLAELRERHRARYPDLWN